jgi:hypothetical protein
VRELLNGRSLREILEDPVVVRYVAAGEAASELAEQELPPAA